MRRIFTILIVLLASGCASIQNNTDAPGADPTSSEAAPAPDVTPAGPEAPQPTEPTTAANKAPSAGGQESLIVGRPESWVLGFRDRSGEVSITEYVPSGQSVEDWREMLTVQILHGSASQVALDDHVGNLQGAWRNACPDSKILPTKSYVENGYAVRLWQQFCPNNPATGSPEITLIKAIKGNDSVYSIFKAWKAIPGRSNAEQWNRAFRLYGVCDDRLSGRGCG